MWPKNIRGINQIELSSVCNLRCVYCAYPNPKLMTRPKQFMSDEVFEGTLRWLKYFVDKGTQGREIGFAGIGEGSLDPKLPERIMEIRNIVGPNRRLSMASNGIAWTPELALKLSVPNLRVSVSLHDPIKAKDGIAALQAAGIFERITMDPVVAPNNWAGQIDWQKPNYRIACQYLGGNLGYVTSLGDFCVCTLDTHGETKIASVLGAPRDIQHAPWLGCKDCYQDWPD